MFSGLISFLGGSAFRMIWGEASHFFTAKQDHEQEMEKLRLNAQNDAAAHERNLEVLRLHSTLGLKEVVVRSELDAFNDAVRDIAKPTGVAWVDAWNGSIRPALASIAIIVVVAEIIVGGFILSQWHQELFGAILGLYVADRSLKHRGK